MNTSARYILTILFIISIHYIISFTHESYGRATSISNLKAKLGVGLPTHSSSSLDLDSAGGELGGGKDFPTAPTAPYGGVDGVNGTLATSPHANATFVILARNTDLHGTVKSIREIEDRFNRRYRYAC